MIFYQDVQNFAPAKGLCAWNLTEAQAQAGDLRVLHKNCLKVYGPHTGLTIVRRSRPRALARHCKWLCFGATVFRPVYINKITTYKLCAIGPCSNAPRRNDGVFSTENTGRRVARYPSSVSEEQSVNLTFRVMHHITTKQTCRSPNSLALLLPASPCTPRRTGLDELVLSHDSHVVCVYVDYALLKTAINTAGPSYNNNTCCPYPSTLLSPLD